MADLLSVARGLRELIESEADAVNEKLATTFAYEASGSHALRNPSLLQRCFRDMYVGASHLVFDERNYVETVKTRLGLEPLPF